MRRGKTLRAAIVAVCRRQRTDGAMSDVRVEVREWHKPQLVERGGGS